MSARRNGNRARCQHDGCEKFAQTRGLCKAHGGGSRCRDSTCNKLAQSRGLCIAHGGGRRCQYEGCSKLAQSKGFCISHGGGRRCTVPNCEKFSQVKGRCKSHSKLTENSDHDDDEDTDVEPMSEPIVERRSAVSPPMAAFPQGYASASSLQRRTPSPPSAYARDMTGRSVMLDSAYASSSLAPLRDQHARPGSGMPRPLPSFGVRPVHPSHMPLLPSRMPGIAREESMEEYRPSATHTLDPFKRVPSINPRFHEEEDVRPLPYTHQLPSSRTIFSSLEEKRGSDDDAHMGYPLLPSRFASSQPPHFTSHSHAEPAVEPTSIPLLSFLDRSKDDHQVRHSSWASSAPSSTFATSTASSASRSGSPSLPSTVLPPLNRPPPNNPP